jgi:16S rRNA (adenine1518-N6/adenine1519-N6)-dimethyltransferase
MSFADRPPRGGVPRPVARKRFGQHFLHDPAVIERIVHALDIKSGDRLVEIGPGRGALTRRLLERELGSLDALEIDRDLAALLRGQLAQQPGFVLHLTNALEFDFGKLAQERGGRLRIIGNLPYNISTPLLFHLLSYPHALTDMHVMLQREVAARMAARPGEPDYGRLTAMLAPWVIIERLFEVGPGAFQPPPRVWSAVLRLRIRQEPAFAVSPRYAAVVAAAFAQRRKTLRNSLRGLLSLEQIKECGLDPGARPETLAPQQLNALAQSLEAHLAKADGPREAP